MRGGLQMEGQIERWNMDEGILRGGLQMEGQIERWTTDGGAD